MSGDQRATNPTTLVRSAAECAAQVVRLLLGRHLHIRRSNLGTHVSLPDRRAYTVFRTTTCDAAAPGQPVMLAVWFHLRAIPPGAGIRRWLFERLCILNTVLFAGFEGYQVKLWMVDPSTSDYAGLYSWTSVEAAERYARYITAVLRPLSVPGTVGFQVSPEWTLDDYVASSAADPSR